MEIAIVGVAAGESGEDGVCRDAKIAMGAGPDPLRARQAEEVLRGHVIDETLARQAGEVAGGEAEADHGYAASAWYRRDMAMCWCARIVERRHRGRRTDEEGAN